MELNNENIKAARQLLCRFLADAAMSKGITQTAMAERTGIAQSNISRILAGKTGMSLDTFLKLAEVTGTRVFLESNSEPGNPAAEFLDQIRRDREGR